MPGIHTARVLGLTCVALLALALSAMSAGATSRIKDLAHIEALRQNHLIGVRPVAGIANGAFIERETEFALTRLPKVRRALRNAAFPPAKRIAAAVTDSLGVKTAEPIDPSTVQLSIPSEFKGNVVAFLTEIEQLQVEPDLAAKIVIDERSGIIVMGRDVRVATVAVAQGNLTVTISESP